MPVSHRPLLLLVLASLALAMLAAGCSGDTDGTGAPRPRIAVVPKGTTHSFWLAVQRGAERAAQETGAELVWKGPLQEDDRTAQIQIVQQFVAEGVDGIALAPLDRVALVGVVQAARQSGIPLVVFDSGLDGTPGVDYVAFVATDNRDAGRRGGNRLAELLGGRGRVAMLRYQVGSASTEAREDGFLEAMAGARGVDVIMSNRYAGATIGEAKTAALNMLDRIREADGVFCSNESATLGMLQALRQEGLAGRKRFVGFDCNEELLAALKDGEIDALVVQDPERMGRQSVQILVQAVAGENTPTRVDTGVQVVTADNLDEPAIARLLK